MKRFACNKRVVSSIVFATLCVLVAVFGFNGTAMADENEETRLTVRGDRYKLGHKSEYAYTESNRVDSFPFERGYAGDFYVVGKDLQSKKRTGEQAFGSGEPVSFSYVYDNSLKKNNEKNWHIYDDGQRKVKGHSFKKDIDSGAIIIERSYDNVSWSEVKTYRDFFSENPKGKSNLYTVSEADVKHGVYFRVTVAYAIRKVTKSRPVLADDYAYAECVEVYTFFIGEYKSTLQIQELFNGTNITSESSTTEGFSVLSESPYTKIYVKKPGDKTEALVKEYSAFTEFGDYTVRFCTAFDDSFTYNIKITEGNDAKEVAPVVYESDGSYKNLKDVSDAIVNPSISRLFIEQTAGYTLKKSEKDGIPAYSISGDSVGLYLLLNYAKEFDNGWSLSKDSYGKKEGQKLFDSVTGEIASGALIVQTSSDGVNWTNLEKDRYRNGLYTTDFQTQYGSGRRILVYTPDGQSVLNGMYIKVMYVYEAEKGGKTRNFVEEYKFYLSNSNTKAVVFHNISVEGKIQEILSEEDQSTIDIYRKAETLEDYTQTLSGFRIDTSGNPTVKYEVRRNGNPVAPGTTGFTDTGRYDINLEAVGETSHVTIFVDRDSSTAAMKKYFGDGFLEGKRVYAETEYPVYVAGLTKYNILGVEESTLPVSGKIINTSTGNEIEITAVRSAKKDVLTEPGEYVAQFFTNKTFTSENPVGDTMIFTFRFIIISEEETPGPVVNYQSLEQFAKSDISDMCPRYYGLTYPSAGKGYITCAFATWEDALEYARAHESGMVEKQEDGSYRYRGEYQMALEQKVKYESTWELTDAIEFFARQAIHEYYFDLSDDFSYITLPQEVIDDEENLRKLELSNSVIIFGEGQREKMMVSDSLPLLSPKKYAYLKPGLDEPVVRGEPHDFEFVEDKYNYDSQKVDITDCNGERYPIAYRKGVGQQLQEAGCASGIVRVYEVNQYNDKHEYEAVFLRENDNLAAVTIKNYDGAVNSNVVITKDSEIRHFVVDAFSPVAIDDGTDKYTYIKITHNGETDYFLSGDKEEKLFMEAGDYTVRCINRLGYSFDFVVTVQSGNRFAVIHCVDDKGTVKEVYTSMGSRNVKLPEFVRRGYEIIGYLDEKGNHYPLNLEEVTFTGSVRFEAEWKAKDCIIAIKDQDGKTLAEVETTFHSTIDVAKQCSKEGIAYVSLLVDGEELTDGLLTVDKEGETVVIASMTVEENRALPEETPEDQGKNRSFIWILVVIVAMAIGGACGIFVWKGKKNGKNQ